MATTAKKILFVIIEREDNNMMLPVTNWVTRCWSHGHMERIYPLITCMLNVKCSGPSGDGHLVILVLTEDTLDSRHMLTICHPLPISNK